MSEKPYKAFVVSHTHWDREWHLSFQKFRIRLVELMDTLLDLMEKKPEFRHFHFDGQTIMLDDYLRVKPQSRSRLDQLIKQGRVSVGPWYNLPDLFLVSGESLIRNLLRGYQSSKEYGEYTRVGYIPDQFGHPTQMPQILQGFGLDNAMFFRGVTTDQVDSEFVWQGPDGSEVLAVKLPDNNAYSNWFYRFRESLIDPDKPLDPDQVETEARALLEDSLSERPTTNNLLFLDGCDHVFPQFKTPEIIRIVNERMPEIEIQHATLLDYLNAVRSQNPGLKKLSGELRWANRKWKLQGILAHVLSSRMHLKQWNHKVEGLLEKYVEPLCSFALILGEKYPAELIDLAWEYLLKNAPHDSICGCSVDQVHRDMLYRYAQSEEICEELLKRTLGQLGKRIDTQSMGEDGDFFITVFNTLGFSRSEIVELMLEIPMEQAFAGGILTDSGGIEIPFHVLKVYPYHTMEQENYDIPVSHSVRRVCIAFRAAGVPSFGYRTYRLRLTPQPNRQVGSLLLSPDTARNEHLELKIHADGTISVSDLNSGHTCCGLLFEDGGDFGDGYNYVKPAIDRIVSSKGSQARISIDEDGPVRATFRIEQILQIPECGIQDKQRRSERTTDCKVTSWVTLAAGARRVDIRTIVENTAKDHRLRVRFFPQVQCETSSAEGAFDVISRTVHTPQCRDWTEQMPSCHPFKSFVDISGKTEAGTRIAGMALIAKGLPEYEASDNEFPSIALTLLRAVGNGVRGYEYQSDGQMLGEWSFEYSVFLHEGNWEDAKVWREAHSFNWGPFCHLTSFHKGDLPTEETLLELPDEALVLSALKKKTDGETLVLRTWNIGNTEVEPLQAVKGCVAGPTLRMNEAEEVKLSNTIQPKEIRTQEFIPGNKVTKAK